MRAGAGLRPAPSPGSRLPTAGWQRRCATLPGFRATCLARRRPTTGCSSRPLGPRGTRPFPFVNGGPRAVPIAVAAEPDVGRDYCSLPGRARRASGSSRPTFARLPRAPSGRFGRQQRSALPRSSRRLFAGLHSCLPRISTRLPAHLDVRAAHINSPPAHLDVRAAHLATPASNLDVHAVPLDARVPGFMLSSSTRSRAGYMGVRRWLARGPAPSPEASMIGPVMSVKRCLHRC